MTVTRPTPTPEQERALDVFRSAQRFLLSGHVRPDGDCLGSQAGLARILQALGKEVVILNPDPPSKELSDLGPFRTHGGGAVPEHDVCVLLDINDLSRCGDLAEPLRQASSLKMVVDHHPFDGEPWWDAAFVDITASATGLLVHRIGHALGVALDEACARALYVALVADTGWFRYSNTDAETMAAGAEMIAAGVRPAEIFARLYQQNAQAEPRALGVLLQGLQYHAEGRLAYLEQALSAEALADADALLDIVRAVGSVEVVLFLKELEGGQCKLSARSKSYYDVNALARHFGGGGHVRASGATIPGTLADVRKALVERAVAGFETGDAEARRADASAPDASAVGGAR